MILENDNPYNKPVVADRRSRIANPTPYGGLGKLPPQATDLEESVLATIFNEANAILYVIDFLRPEMFYKDAHQKIFGAIMTLFQKNNPIDEATVIHQLRSQGELEMVGGAYFIVEIAKATGSSASIEFNARIINQKFIAREMIRISTETINDAYDDTADILSIVANNQSAIFGLIATQHGKKVKKMRDLISRRREEYKITPENGLTGIGSGLSSVDVITCGWQKSDLVIIAARPAMGKTAFVLAVAKNAAIIHKQPVAIFELEMSEDQITDRLISSETGIYQDKIIRHMLSEEDFRTMDEQLVKLNDAEIYIDDTAGLTLLGLRSKLVRLKQLYGIQLAVIDYLQLMHSDGTGKETRDQVIGKITRGVKMLAKELNIPILLLSQLSRAVEERPGDKRPRLSDLRESGSIEQDADSVIFLYRPEYYGIKELNGKPTVGLCQAIWAKHRNGICDTANLDFNGSLMRFSDWTGDTDFGDSKSKFKRYPSRAHPTLNFNPPVPEQTDDEDLPF